MTRPVLALALGLFACNGSGGGDVGTATGTGTGTATGGGTTTGGPTTPTPGVGSASCALDSSNALRIRCNATLADVGVTHLTLTANGAPTRNFTSEEGTQVEVVGWGLKPDTEYTWTIGGETGTVSTGSIPNNLTAATIQTSGAPVGLDAVLIPLNCTQRYFVMIDGDGDIIWYEQNDLYQNGMDAYEWTGDDHSLLIGNGSDVVEIAAGGGELNNWTVADNVHHDLTRWNGYTYMLFNYTTQNVTVDAVYVYDGPNHVGTFDFADHYDITENPPGGGGPGGNEWGHANGINPSEDGQIVTSLKNWNSLVTWDGDPDSATFGEVLWVVEGDANGLSDADYSPPAGSDEGFGNQHNATWWGEQLYLFDNDGVSGTSRAARYSLDDTTGEVRYEEGWSVQSNCPTEGGAVPVDGGILGTCANNGDIFEFRDGEANAAFELSATCGGGGGGPGGLAMNRGIPIHF